MASVHHFISRVIVGSTFCHNEVEVLLASSKQVTWAISHYELAPMTSYSVTSLTTMTSLHRPSLIGWFVAALLTSCLIGRSSARKYLGATGKFDAQGRINSLWGPGAH